MFRSAIAMCALCTAVQVQAANTYFIDSANSFASSYSAVWKNAGPVFGDSTLPGEPGPLIGYNWDLEWQVTPYAISGRFDTQVIQSPVDPSITRLQLSNIHITSPLPASAGFSLPNQLWLSAAGDLRMTDSPCDDDGFFGSPGGYSSCWIDSLATRRVDEGRLLGEGLSLAGERSRPILYFGGPDASLTPPELSNYPSGDGLFAYSIRAMAIPEPGSLMLALLGLGLLAKKTRRAPPPSAARNTA